MARRKLRIPAVVPRIVFSTAFIGVIPACVAQACTSGSSLNGTDSGLQEGVAFQCFDASDPRCRYGVAAVAFQCFDGSTDPGCRQFNVADAAFGDAPLDALDGANDSADGAG